MQLVDEDHEDMTKVLEEFMSNAPSSIQQDLIVSQSNLQKSPSARRWDSQIISLALRIYSTSQKGYKNLKSPGVLVPPSKQTLSVYKNAVKQKPGVNEENLA